MAAANTLFVPDFSRYKGTNVYQDKASGQMFFGPWGAIDFPEALDDRWVRIRGRDGLRLDLVASAEYGTPQLWWVLAAANQISNPFTQLYGYAAYARSPLIFSDDARACFYATAMQYGENKNVDELYGLTFKTTATTFRVYVAGELTETFENLTPYPLNVNGSINYKFWGRLISAWVKINWVATDILQPVLSGIPAPVPTVISSYLTGGVDDRMLSLRVPSLTNVMSILDSAISS